VFHLIGSISCAQREHKAPVWPLLVKLYPQETRRLETRGGMLCTSGHLWTTEIQRLAPSVGSRAERLELSAENRS
jgi:hypothetical protein